MEFVNESLAKGLVNRIFRNLYKVGETTSLFNNQSQRKLCKKIKGICKTKNSAVFIAERYAETNNWQIIWGEWTLFSSSASFGVGADPLESYDKIAFDLTINVRGTYSYKSYYIVLTKHALLRLIMRCKESIVNSHELYAYLKNITKHLVFASLELADVTCRTSSPTEGYTVVNGVFLPLSFTFKYNKRLKPTAMCNVITFMPDDYDSAKRKFKEHGALTPSSNFFDYEDLFVILDNKE
jgi:hypothetical protein